MHARTSNSKLVEPLPEPERTLNRRLHRRNRRVPLKQRNNPPQHPRIVYPPILDINYFHHFLNIFQNLNPMDDEPMWAADRVVSSTPGSAITIPETEEMFKNCHGHNLSKGNIIKIFYHGLNEITQEVLNAATGGIFLYKTLNQAYQLLEDKKMDAQYKYFQSRSKQPNLDDDDIPMSREEEAKFMQTFRHNRFYNDYRDRDSNRDNWRSSGRNDYNRDNYQSHSDDKPDL
ncbi:hypothetical protein Tco_1482304 [Tanacetum coccineum]